jgi:GrpB-like predicted nucleotidyltransferase (UPF0157 family)
VRSTGLSRVDSPRSAERTGECTYGNQGSAWCGCHECSTLRTVDEAHLDRVLIGGRERREIVIAEYDPGWPRRFAVERERLAAALGDRALRIEHIGSTSVPGLAAKPIVDILVEVPSLDGVDLERAGYVLRVREEGHRMFRTPELDVHVHVWPTGSPNIVSHLAFRDRLRASAEDRAAYEALKRELAAREWPDMNHYAEAKGPLIREIRARGG